jgi:hypothetical protein
LELREENEKLKNELQKCPKGSVNGGNWILWYIN